MNNIERDKEDLLRIWHTSHHNTGQRRSVIEACARCKSPSHINNMELVKKSDFTYLCHKCIYKIRFGRSSDE